jgi:hypothetical protein
MTKVSKNKNYAQDAMAKAMNKVKSYQRDMLTYDKTIKDITSQIEIKTFYLNDVKNKLENKLLNETLDEILPCDIKKEKI